MKKLILAFAFLLVANLGMAQSKEAFKADVLKMIQVTGSAGQMKLAKEQILQMIPKEKHAAFLVRI